MYELLLLELVGWVEEEGVGTMETSSACAVGREGSREEEEEDVSGCEVFSDVQ